MTLPQAWLLLIPSAHKSRDQCRNKDEQDEWQGERKEREEESV